MVRLLGSFRLGSYRRLGTLRVLKQLHYFDWIVLRQDLRLTLLEDSQYHPVQSQPFFLPEKVQEKLDQSYGDCLGEQTNDPVLAKQDRQHSVLLQDLEQVRQIFLD